MKKRKTLRNILIGLLLAIIIILFFAPRLAGWYVQKNGQVIIGRNISIEKLRLNYFTVTVNIQDFVLFEENNTDTFVAFNQFHLNYQPWQLVKNEYAVKKFLLDGLYVQIQQQGNNFNFDDLTTADTTISDSLESKSEKDVRFSLKNISITNSNFNYYDKEIDNLITLHNFNLNLPLLAWNSDQSDVGLDFRIGNQGHLKINANIDNDNEKYTVHTQIDSLNLEPFSLYLKPFVNSSGIDGFFSSNITVNGSMTDFTKLTASGHANIFDFVLPDSTGAPVFTTKLFHTGFDSINLSNQYYALNTIQLEQPQFWIEKGKQATNIEALLAPLMITDTTENIDSTNAGQTETDTSAMPVFYSIDSVLITNGAINYTDASLNRPFKYNISALNLAVSDITPQATSVPVELNMVLNNKGIFEANADIDMLNIKNIEFTGDINNLELLSFSPYTEYFIAGPIKQGVFNYHIDVKMTADELINENKIAISELEFGQKTADTTAFKLPLRLALYILKDKDDNIAFDVPVSGNPSDPKFSLGRIIWKTFSKFIVKTATEPFSALASLAGTNPENLEKIEMDFTQDTLSLPQKSTLKNLAGILHKKPGFVFTLTQETPMEIEKQELAAKQLIIKYLLETKLPKTYTDSLFIYNNWKNFKRNETGFISYVENLYAKEGDLSIEQKCAVIIGDEEITRRFNQLLEQRNINVAAFLTDSLGVNHENIVVHTADIVNIHNQIESPMYRVEVSLK